MLDAIGHLMDADRAEDATALFLDSALHEDLHWWGYYDVLSDYCQRFLSCHISPKKKITLNIQLGKISRNLGNHKKAKEIYEKVLPLIDETNDPESEIRLLNALGDINYFLENLNLALEYLQRADELLNIYPNTILQSENTGDLGNVKFSLRKYKEAQRFYEQAIAFARKADSKIGRIYEGIWNGDLGNVHNALFFSSGNNPMHRESAISHYLLAIAIAEKEIDRRNESHFNGFLGCFYRSLGENELAEVHLKKAFSMSEKILYGRLINTQAATLADLYIKKRDFEKAYQVGLAFQQVANKIGNSEIVAEAELLLIGQRLHRIAFFFQDGQIDEAIAEGRKLLVSFAGKADVCVFLGSTCMQWGRQTGQKDFFQWSIEAYTNAITVSTDDSRYGLYSGRADAYALLGKFEEAIADYNEATKQEPQNTVTALSRAEVQIWAGRYGEARLSLEALYPQLATIEEKAIGAWLMCHALNLAGHDFSTFQKVLAEETNKNIALNYSVRDIEIYLQQLDQMKFSKKQISNAWKIQSLITKFVCLFFQFIQGLGWNHLSYYQISS